VFSASGKASALERAIEGHLEAELGFEVPTFVRRVADVRRLAAAEPFDRVGEGDTHLIGFLRRRPSAAATKATEALSNDTDRLVVDGRELHWRIHGKVMDSTVKDTALAKALAGDPPTTRNVTMVRTLAAKLDG
jgi:uncharacterized protein (DUF1697 family)